MRRHISLYLALGFLAAPASGHAAEPVIEDTFKGVEIMMPNGESKLYPDPRLWAFTFWPGVKWPDSSSE